MILLLLALLTTQSSPAPPYRSLDQANLLACHVSDDECLGREFALRKDADQGVRRASDAELGCQEGDQTCLAAAWKRVDDDNFSRLRSIVTARGWPPLKGEAAQGAWLIETRLPKGNINPLAQTGLVATGGSIGRASTRWMP